MDHNKKHLKLFEKLFSGTTTERENAFLSSLPEAEFEELFRRYSDWHWENAHDQMDSESMERMQQDIMSRISARDSIFSNKKTPLRIFMKAAACIVFAFICITVGYVLSDRLQEENWFELVADKGQRSSLILPDGSSVCLNSGSRIRYSSAFNKDNRNIHLNGEAYFDVVKNGGLPFRVTAQEMTVTALGTKFNVKAYDDENTVTATLIQGKIMAEAENMSEIITPNRMVIYDRNTNLLKTGQVKDASAVTAWAGGRLTFSGETLEEIARILVRRYDVEVIFEDDACKNVRYNGLVRDDSLTNVLNLITSSSTVKCRVDGGDIHFSSK